MEEIFVSRQGHQYGPYTLEQVQNYLAQGLIVASDSARISPAGNLVTIETLLTQWALATTAPAAIDRTGQGAQVIQQPPVSRETEIQPSSGGVFLWPFRQHNWWKSLWMPALACLPLFGWVISFGWTVCVIRRRAMQLPELPQPSNFSEVVKSGLLMFFMAVLYFVVPSLLALGAISAKFTHDLAQIWSGGFLFVLFHPAQLMKTLAEQEAFESVWEIVPVLLVMLAWPFYVLGELRYAVTGKALSFLNLFGNSWLFLRHFGKMSVFLFLVTLIRVPLYGLSAVMTAALSETVIFALVPLVLLPLLAHWMTVRLAGNLAREFCLSGSITPPADRFGLVGTGPGDSLSPTLQRIRP